MAQSTLFTVLLLSLPRANAQAPQRQPPAIDYANESVTKLIDDLTEIDAQSLGIDSAAIYDGFIVDDVPASFRGGVLGVAPPSIPEPMRELVRRGPTALAQLIQHLDDKRSTKLKVGNVETSDVARQVGVNLFMFEEFGAEYDPRIRKKSNASSSRRMRTQALRDFTGSYSVKVGDVCFVLVGQIVNRRLLAVRYQPSAGLVVNSPIESPELARRAKDDWGSADAEVVRNSLLYDIRSKEIERTVFPALRRLQFYFPDLYTALEGNDAKERIAFEERGKSASLRIANPLE